MQVVDAHNNYMDSCTTGALALCPSSNEQEGHYFYSLSSSRKLHKNKWTELPIPNDIIRHVENLGKSNDVVTELEFGNRLGIVSTDDEEIIGDLEGTVNPVVPLYQYAATDGHEVVDVDNLHFDNERNGLPEAHEAIEEELNSQPLKDMIPEADEDDNGTEEQNVVDNIDMVGDIEIDVPHFRNDVINEPPQVNMVEDIEVPVPRLWRRGFGRRR